MAGLRTTLWGGATNGKLRPGQGERRLVWAAEQQQGDPSQVRGCKSKTPARNHNKGRQGTALPKDCAASPRAKGPFGREPTTPSRMPSFPLNAPRGDLACALYLLIALRITGQASDTAARTEPLTTHPPLEVVLLHVAHGGKFLTPAGQPAGIRVRRSREPSPSPGTASKPPTVLHWQQRKMAPQSVRSAPDTTRGGGAK